MATPKRVFVSENSQRTRVIANVECCKKRRRNEQRYMLLSTSYELNVSCTKKLHVGLQPNEKNTFAPFVKLTGNHTEGICFDEDSWKQFRENMKLVSAYLNGDNKAKQNPIVIREKIIVNFTSAYGSKAVLLAYNEEEEEEEKEKDKSTASPNSKDNTAASKSSTVKEEEKEEEEEEESQPPTKKRKTFAVAIVMQKNTVLGLENVISCVDERLKQLNAIAENVNECASYLASELELNLPRNYVNDDIAKHTLCGNYNLIERNVRIQIKNLPFLDTYFDIVFLEMIALRFSEIIRLIRIKRELKNNETIVEN